MNISFSKAAEKSYIKLPQILKKKFRKQISYLEISPNHPSLRLKRMQGTPYFEVRIDIHYRIIFTRETDKIHIHAIGPHDTGLGKK